MREHLLFVSSNLGKVREVEAILGMPVDQMNADIPEIQALDVEEVARQKARVAYELAGRPVMVEDTGLYLDALSGLPGALVRWFLLTIGPAGICRLIPPGAERGATARSVVAVCRGESVEVFIGETRGTIASAPIGDGGFGWDPIFRPTGASGTFAQMAQVEKNTFSMRHAALMRLRTAIGDG